RPRQERGADMAARLGAQGVAAVARDPGSEDLLLILLAPNSAVPDVLRWHPGSVRDAIAKLDSTPRPLRSDIGLTTVDVRDLEYPVVVAVDEAGGAMAKGIHPGDVIGNAGGKRVRNAA